MATWVLKNGEKHGAGAQAVELEEVREAAQSGAYGAERNDRGRRVWGRRAGKAGRRGDGMGGWGRQRSSDALF